jgi:hypothetical protein
MSTFACRQLHQEKRPEEHLTVRERSDGTKAQAPGDLENREIWPRLAHVVIGRNADDDALKDEL